MRRGGRGAEGAHDGAVVFVEKVDAVGASGIPAGGPGLVVFEGEAVALGRGHFSGLDEFIFGGGEIVAGDDAFFAEQHGAAGAGFAGELHERGEIKLVAAQRALADNEVVEQARLEPRGDVATQDDVFAVIDAGGEAEAAPVFRTGGIEDLAGVAEERGHELGTNRSPARIGDGKRARVDAVFFLEEFNERFFEAEERGMAEKIEVDAVDVAGRGVAEDGEFEGADLGVGVGKFGAVFALGAADAELGMRSPEIAVELAGERIVFRARGVVTVHAHRGVAKNAVGAAGLGDDVEGVGAISGEAPKGVGGDLVTATAEVGDAGADEFGRFRGKIHAAAGGDAPFEDGDGGVGVAGDLLAEVVGVFVPAAEKGAEAIVIDDDELGPVAGLGGFGGQERQ